MKQLLRLALVDCVKDSDEFVEYGVHTLVHERVISRLPTEEATQYLSTCSNILAAYFPFLLDVQDSSSDARVARYLIAHALHQIEIGRRLGYQERRLDTLASMTPAISLYRKIGFVPMEGYCYNPIENRRTWCCVFEVSGICGLWWSMAEAALRSYKRDKQQHAGEAQIYWRLVRNTGFFDGRFSRTISPSWAPDQDSGYFQQHWVFE